LADMTHDNTDKAVRVWEQEISALPLARRAQFEV